MTVPVRLQLSRRKGFNLQALSQATNGLPAVSVMRPGHWGNPFPVAKVARALAGSYDWSGRCTAPLWNSWATSHLRGSGSGEIEAEIERIAAATAVAMFAAEARHFARTDAAGFVAWLSPLKGRNLACSCKPDAPCHADVLLELANRPVCEEA